MTYWELLKDPRWQRKRLEILERESFTCEECGDTKTTLHVHHMYYRKGWKPWEYPAESLRSLCEHCHVAVAEAQEFLQSATAWMGVADLIRLAGTAHADRVMYTFAPAPCVFSAGAGSELPPTARLPYAQGVSRVLDIPGRALLEAPDQRVITYTRIRDLSGSPIPDGLQETYATAEAERTEPVALAAPARPTPQNV